MLLPHMREQAFEHLARLAWRELGDAYQRELFDQAWQQAATLARELSVFVFANPPAWLQL